MRWRGIGRGTIAESRRGRVPATLNEAIVAYLGKGRSASPSVNWTDPEKRFDPAVRHAAEDVVSHLDAIATGWTTDDWNEADARVRADLVSTFPELDEAAVNALLWKFDYDWK